MSYSSADRKAAERIFRRLESFSIPKSLRGRELYGLTLDKKLQPVFRDRDELSSSGNLAGSIENALKNSTSLVVLCSPHAAKSRWVDMEIRSFGAIHGYDRIFPLILDGNPGSGDELECFAPALLEGTFEPIAGDFRKEGDGPNLALLKIVAGILDTPFDTLRNRAAQQRQRKLIVSLTAALAIAFTTSLLAVYALQQRGVALAQEQIANTRRAQAEGLISFMLGDLRARLQTVGRLDVLEAVGVKAQDYFEELPPSELSDDTLASQATALRQLGEIRIEQGSYDDSQRAFLAALIQTEELHNRNPTSGSILYELSQVQFWVGYSHYLGSNMAQARIFYEAYLVSAQHLVALEPSNPDYQIELAYAFSNIGTMELEQNQADRAREAFHKCEAILRSLAEAQPNDTDLVFETAATNSWLAKTYLVEYRMNSGLEHRLLAAQQHTQVAAATGHPFHKKMEAEAWSLLADTYFLKGDVDAALENASRAQLIYEELQRQDPDNIEWKIRLLFHRHLHALFEFYLQPDALKYQRIGVGIAATAELAMADMGNQEWTEITVEMMGNSMMAGALLGEMGAYRQYAADYPDLLDRFSLDDLVLASESPAVITLAVKLTAATALYKSGVLSDDQPRQRQGLPDPESMQIISDVSEKSALALLYAAYGHREESRVIMEFLTEAGYVAPQVRALIALRSGESHQATHE